MRGITKVMVVVDTKAEQQWALQKAIKICRAMGAKLHILAPKADATALKQLAAQAASVKEVMLYDTWHNSYIETVIHVRQMTRCHLLVKDVKPLTLRHLFQTPVDWSLLRHCRVPVLLVQSEQDWFNGSIVAAVNAESQQHSVLNQAILQYATEVAEMFSASTHLATAIPATMLNNPLPRPDNYRQLVKMYVRKFALNEAQVHVRLGPAPTMIQSVLQETDGRLLVLGTHARAGISAMAIGNTAEQLLHDVKTDMLVLQPKHHMIPLERELSCG